MSSKGTRILHIAVFDTGIGKGRNRRLAKMYRSMYRSRYRNRACLSVRCQKPLDSVQLGKSPTLSAIVNSAP